MDKSSTKEKTRQFMLKFKTCQEDHRAVGYHVERLSGGQVRRYGPTEYKYIVISLEHDREETVREYCTTEVKKADDPQKHLLLMHLVDFKKLGPRTYYYQCGHEWTG